MPEARPLEKPPPPPAGEESVNEELVEVVRNAYAQMSRKGRVCPRCKGKGRIDERRGDAR